MVSRVLPFLEFESRNLLTRGLLVSLWTGRKPIKAAPYEQIFAFKRSYNLAKKGDVAAIISDL